MKIVRTLIVEDEHSLLVSLVRSFPDLCKNLTIAGSIDALGHALMDEFYDLIICDKDISGGSTVNYWEDMITRHGEARGVIIWSGSWADQDEEFARGLGATVLHKPDLNGLKKAIAEAIARL